MSMSRKHYQALAEALAKPMEDVAENALATKLVTILSVVDTIGTVCYEDNNRFDYDKFVEAFLHAIGEEKLDYYRCQRILRTHCPKYAKPRP